MVDIQKLLEKRAQYPLENNQRDTWVDDVLAHHRDEKEQWIVVPSIYLASRIPIVSKQRGELFGCSLEKHTGAYYVTALFDLGNPNRQARVSYSLVSLSKVKPKMVKIASYNGGVCTPKGISKNDKEESPTVAKKQVDKYTRYINKLQVWCNMHSLHQESEDPAWEMCEIPYEKFDFMHPEPRYYTKSRMGLRTLLKEADVDPLSSVAEVITPRGNIENGPCFKFSNAEYPFNWDSVESRSCSETRIQKGDILVSVFGKNIKVYLFDDDSENELYAPRSSVVIVRPKTVPSEFLFLYLKGETGQDLPGALSDIADSGFVVPRISKKSLLDYPVLRKTENPELYRKYFQYRYLHDAKLGDFNVFLGRHNDDKVKHPEDVLSRELVDKLRFYKREIVLSLINRDVDELNICYKNGAYKSTLIMAGSILEGLAIDWLSEMLGVDFFGDLEPEECMKQFGKNQPDLKSYISTIAKKCPYMRVPEWMTKASAQEFKTKATEIRLKRNLVHATLCLKECETIDKNLCDNVIGYLKEIIKIRFGKDV